MKYTTLFKVIAKKEKKHYSRMLEMYNNSGNLIYKFIMFPILFIIITLFHYMFTLMHFLFESFEFLFHRSQFENNIKKLLEHG